LLHVLGLHFKKVISYSSQTAALSSLNIGPCNLISDGIQALLPFRHKKTTGIFRLRDCLVCSGLNIGSPGDTLVSPVIPTSMSTCDYVSDGASLLQPTAHLVLEEVDSRADNDEVRQLFWEYGIVEELTRFRTKDVAFVTMRSA
jgi:hypothetical protein